MKNSNDTIGNRTRDLPACSAVPQPTEPPRDPQSGNISRWKCAVHTQGSCSIEEYVNFVYFTIRNTEQFKFQLKVRLDLTDCCMKNDTCVKDGGRGGKTTRSREGAVPRKNDTTARKMQDSRNTIYYLNTPQIFHFSPASQRWIAFASQTVQQSRYHRTDTQCPAALCSGPVRLTPNCLPDTTDNLSN